MDPPASSRPPKVGLCGATPAPHTEGPLARLAREAFPQVVKCGPVKGEKALAEARVEELEVGHLLLPVTFTAHQAPR